MAVDISIQRTRLDRILNLFRKLGNKTAQEYIDGKISLLDFHLMLKNLIKRQNAMMVFAGTGAEKPADVLPKQWLVLGNEIRKQFNYLAEFVRQLNESQISEGEIFNRVDLYMESAGASFWRSVSPVELPAYPKDGTTQCLSNCGCHWVFDYVMDSFGNHVAVLAYWTLGELEHCPDCVQRHDEWNPIRVSI